VLDNLLFPELPKIYFNCLIFYESFQNFYNLKGKYEKLIKKENKKNPMFSFDTTSEISHTTRSLNSSFLIETRTPRTFLRSDFKKDTHRSSVDSEIKLYDEFSDIKSMHQIHSFNFKSSSKIFHNIQTQSKHSKIITPPRRLFFVLSTISA